MPPSIRSFESRRRCGRPTRGASRSPATSAIHDWSNHRLGERPAGRHEGRHCHAGHGARRSRLAHRARAVARWHAAMADRPNRAGQCRHYRTRQTRRPAGASGPGPNRPASCRLPRRRSCAACRSPGSANREPSPATSGRTCGLLRIWRPTNGPAPSGWVGSRPPKVHRAVLSLRRPASFFCSFGLMARHGAVEGFWPVYPTRAVMAMPRNGRTTP